MPTLDDLVSNGSNPPQKVTLDTLLASGQNKHSMTLDDLVGGSNDPHAQVTQPFGNINPDVEVMSGGVNNGTDFDYKYGTPVKAPKGQWEVEDSFSGATGHGSIGDNTNSGYGNSVKLKNLQTGETIRLSHLSTNLAQPGMVISGGSLVGLSGDTGNASGPHLDVEYTTSTGEYGDVTQTPYAPSMPVGGPGGGGEGGGNPLLDTVNTVGKAIGSQPFTSLPPIPGMKMPTYGNLVQGASSLLSGQDSALSLFLQGKSQDIPQQQTKQIHQTAQALKNGDPGVALGMVDGGMPVKSTPLPPIPAFAGAKSLTTNTLDRLVGKTSVAPQYIQDLTKMADVKDAEKNVVNSVLGKYNQAKVPVQEFAQKVEDELLPLDRTPDFRKGGRYDNIHLPQETRGNVTNYKESVYNSPIPTSAGRVHFEGHDNYFAHTRTEDIPDIGSDVGFAGENLVNRKTGKVVEGNLSPERFKELSDLFDKGGKTRRVLELQSDLFQKGRLDQEFADKIDPELSYLKGQAEKGRLNEDFAKWDIPKQEQYLKQKAQLKPYENTWHERVIREEVKKAAEDGKTNLQFPTGETAMKIEGLGENSDNWVSGGNRIRSDDLKVGKEVGRVGIQEGWIITDVLGDGKFKAMSKDLAESYGIDQGNIKHANLKSLESDMETFDISGKVDQNNPIYKFYESEVGKYLKNHYQAERTTDPQGVSWWQLHVPQSAAKKAVKALGILPPIVGAAALANPQQQQESNY